MHRVVVCPAWSVRWDARECGFRAEKRVDFLAFTKGSKGYEGNTGYTRISSRQHSDEPGAPIDQNSFAFLGPSGLKCDAVGSARLTSTPSSHFPSGPQ